MKKTARVMTGFTVAAILLIAANIQAASPPSTGQPKSAVAIDAIKAEITAIEAKEKSIKVKVLEGTGKGKEKTIEVPANTKIQKNNKDKQRLKDLKEGDTASINYKKVKRPDATGKAMVEKLEAVQITVLTSKEADTSSAAPTIPPAPAAP